MKIENCRTVNEDGKEESISSDSISVVKCLMSAMNENVAESQFLYRGVGKEFLTDRLSKEGSEIDDYKLCCRLFYFGEKAKYFRDEVADRKRYRWLLNLEDLSRKTTDIIFDKINGLRASTNDVIARFREDNKQFIRFFEIKTNKAVFYEALREAKLLARDYYLAILHTAGKIGIGDRSILVSSSKEFEEARKFTPSNGDAGYILCFVDRSKSVDSSMELVEAVLSEKGVPMLANGVSIFPSQRERTLRCGIFPQDIICVYCIHSEEVIFNPHLFSGLNGEVDIVKDRLMIDQSSFEKDLIEMTNYSRYFWTADTVDLYEGLPE